MNVADLIAILQTMPPERPVVFLADFNNWAGQRVTFVGEDRAETHGGEIYPLRHDGALPVVVIR
jgi:hypothetical protein